MSDINQPVSLTKGLAIDLRDHMREVRDSQSFSPATSKGGLNRKPNKAFEIRGYDADNNRTIVIGMDREEDWYPFEDVVFLPNGTKFAFTEAEYVVLSNDPENYTLLSNGLYRAVVFYTFSIDGEGEWQAVVTLADSMPDALTEEGAFGTDYLYPLAYVTVYLDDSMDFNLYHIYDVFNAGGSASGGSTTYPAVITSGGPGDTYEGDIYANGIGETATSEGVTIKILQIHEECTIPADTSLLVVAVGDHYEGQIAVWLSRGVV